MESTTVLAIGTVTCVIATSRFELREGGQGKVAADKSGHMEINMFGHVEASYDLPVAGRTKTFPETTR
jgi:hypothetical protein